MTSQTRSSILLVDDEPDFCRNLRDILEDLNYRVEVAASASEALAKAAHQRYQLHLVDFRMPGMSGVELASQLRRLDPPAPTVLISAFINQEVERAAADAGCRRVLTKPVDVPRLIDAVAALLQGGDAQEQAT